MDTTFAKSENRKTFNPRRAVFNLKDKLNLK